MKRLKKLLLALSLTIAISQTTPVITTYTTVEAYSGRTDSSGGHHDYKNKSGLGSYHYHHGYKAHLHTGGVCPYSNGTASSSSSSSSSSASNSTSTTNTNSGSDSSRNNANANNGTNNTNNNNTVITIIISDTSYDNVAFNASYYATNHSDVYEAYGDNAKELYTHFITSGIYEGRQSSGQFSILVYKSNNQDLVDAFGDDLIKYYNHFIEYGVNEDRVSK